MTDKLAAPAAPSGEQTREQIEHEIANDCSRRPDSEDLVESFHQLLVAARLKISTLRRERGQESVTMSISAFAAIVGRAETAESRLRELTAERERLLKSADEMCKYEAELRSTIERLTEKNQHDTRTILAQAKTIERLEGIDDKV